MKLKLTYFPGRGRGEMARIIMAYGGIPYENNRISMEDWAAKVKATTPFGVLPMLEVDGNIISETMAINRFLAKKAGIYGSNDLEQAQVDMVVDQILEQDNNVFELYDPKGEKNLEAMAKVINEEKLPNYIKNMEKLLVSRGGKHFVGNKLTWADIATFNHLQMLTDPTEPLLTKFMKNAIGDARLKLLDNAPHLKALHKMVGEVPGIKKWLQTRPGNDAEMF